ncbi:MAG: dephospho-CoA kinase [Curvibacter sp.]|jgi:dephospho-CoA kinase|nr:dephospho-CoA kinase [Curvibacter sp.]
MPEGLRLGLTGGIGSGKSTVASLLAGLGARVIDADAISRELTAADGQAIPAIREAFGTEVISTEGSLDRARMRSLVFGDPAARRRLEQILHPLIGLESRRQAEHATRTGYRCVVLDIPLLVESSHWRPQLDQVLVLDCTPRTQIDRVMQRSGLTQAEVEAILAQQASRRQRLRAADHVIFNEGLSLAELGQVVHLLASRLGL